MLRKTRPRSSTQVLTPDQRANALRFCYLRYAPRHDCGCEYEIEVELLNQKKKTIVKFAPETVYFEQWSDRKWKQVCVRHSFIL